MRKGLLSILLAAAGILSSNSSLILAQQSATKDAQVNNLKPCVVISGAVRSPARYEIQGRIRLAELLLMAGGVTEQAGKAIQIFHSRLECFQAGAREKATPSDDSHPIAVNLKDLLRGDEKANPYLEAGDVVIFAESDPIYVTGNVVSPRAIPSDDPVTLTQAIAMAGGTTSKANTNKVVIYRHHPNSNGFEHITVDLLEIRKQRSPDPVLKPYDIVDVGGVGGLVPAAPMFDSRPLITLSYRFLS